MRAVEGRRRKLETKRGRHLAMIDDLVPWQASAGDGLAQAEEGAQVRGRAQPWDAVLDVQGLSCALHNLSDEGLVPE